MIHLGMNYVTLNKRDCNVCTFFSPSTTLILINKYFEGLELIQSHMLDSLKARLAFSIIYALHTFKKVELLDRSKDRSRFQESVAKRGISILKAKRKENKTIFRRNNDNFRRVLIARQLPARVNEKWNFPCFFFLRHRQKTVGQYTRYNRWRQFFILYPWHNPFHRHSSSRNDCCVAVIYPRNGPRQNTPCSWAAGHVACPEIS